MIAHRATEAPGELALRIERRDLEHTARGIPPKQRTLRTLEDRNLRDVVKRQHGTGHGRDVDAVDIGSDGVLNARTRRRCANAAEPRLRRTGGGGEVQCRRGDLKIGRARDASGGQGLRRKRGDRDRHVLQVLGTLLCGDDDVRDRRLVGISVRRLRRGRWCGGDRDRLDCSLIRCPRWRRWRIRGRSR